MKQQLSLSYGWRENRGGGEEGLAECLSFCQVLLGPPHNKEMDWKVEKEDREASMIYCLQGGHCIQLFWQLIYQRKPNILHHLQRDILQIHITSSVVLWLNKSIKNSYVPRQVCVTMRTHSHSFQQRSGIYQSFQITITFQRRKNALQYLCAVKWTQGYNLYCVLQFTPFSLAVHLCLVQPYTLWNILCGCWEADPQSAMKAIFTLARVWLKVFFQHSNAMIQINGYLMFTHSHIL